VLARSSCSSTRRRTDVSIQVTNMVVGADFFSVACAWSTRGACRAESGLF
jgi:hypothetical protein